MSWQNGWRQSPEPRFAEKTREYQEMQSSALAAAKRGYVDDIIVPDATRKRLIMAFEMLEGKRQLRDSKKHAAV